MFIAKKVAELAMFTATANIAVNWGTQHNALQALFRNDTAGWVLIGLFTLAALFTVFTSAMNLALCKQQDTDHKVANGAYVAIASVLTVAGLWKKFNR
jgi:hypothetical protein